MRGAILFLMTFVAVVPSARAPVVAAWEETLGRIAAQYPASYSLLLTMAAACLLSGLIMTAFPRAKRAPRQVLRCFQGMAATTGRHG